MSSEMDFRTAICQALDEELEHDDSVIFFGEDVAAAGGVFARSTAPIASSTPRSPSLPWRAPPMAAPSAACAR